MLIKEYRIPLPLTVEEYRIAQLYMIAKKSREESSGEGSGVEILVNEPYDDGPGGKGQYTQKIYHVGSHLPGWFKSLLPKSALTVSEEAWNAYPYTKTRYTCPFVEKFSLEIETYYYSDNGHQENVFKLTGSELKSRVVDVIDVCKDQLYGADYVREEDPKLFESEKCNRGPLTENWLEEYWSEVQGKPQPLPNGKSLMCAYKLCKVEFRYWGMQTKLEKFIHDVALRKTMLRAHRQAWAWQDEWHGLTMDDIREIERQTQLALQKKMAGDTSDEQDLSEENSKSLAATMSSLEKNEDVPTPLVTKKNVDKRIQKHLTPEGTPPSDHKTSSKTNLRSSSSGSIKSLQAQAANWRMETLVRESETETGSEDEFYDCESSFNKWSSMCSLDEADIDISPSIGDNSQEDSIFNPSFLKRVTSERGSRRMPNLQSHPSVDGCPETPVHSSCPTTVLILVFHAGSVLDANVDMTAKKSDVTTFKGAFESVMRQHYPTLIGHIAIKLVSCPSICTDALGILSTLSPYSFDCSPSTIESPSLTNDLIPIGAIPLIATNSPDYAESVTKTIHSANATYNEFIKSDDGKGFTGQVCFVGDSMGSVLAYDALIRTQQYQSRHDSENSILDTEITIPNDPLEPHYLNKSHLQAPTPRRRSSSTSDNHIKFEFEVSDFFTFGSPLSLILASRKISDDKTRDITKPPVQQVFNLFHPTDPVGSRLEPLLSARFTNLPPINVARYTKYPLGNGQPYHLMELIQSHPQLFGDHLQMPPTPVLRRLSEVSVQSTVSGLVDNIPLITMNALQQKWWGSKRLDYALYCPEGLTNFPTNALPHLFHASYWESSDVIAFILRQIGHFDLALYGHSDDKECPMFKPGQEREKWMRKRTSVKLKNVAANHRANDVIVKEGCPQTFSARFMYGPLDMITLTGEKVDIYMMKDPPAGEWAILSTVVTDKTGRITYTLPERQSVACGIYPVRVVVRGDHTMCNFHLAVVPPQTECVVFSIDGSFTASVSVTGRDPKVRAGAVDVVRFWQDLGYLILYITGRPDMQQRKVISWLAEHNFPHGLVFFSDGFSTDPLGHKAAHLNNLITEHGVIMHAAYGSGKDITVYHNCGLAPKQIYAIGRISKKYSNMATTLNDGYASHLADLKLPGASRPARGNARLLVPRRLLAPVSGGSISRIRR